MRVTRSIPSAVEISPRRAASYRAASACDRTSVGATSVCSAATEVSPAAIRSNVSQSTTKRVTPETFHRPRPSRTLVVLASEDGDERVRVTVTHAMLRLEPLHLLHVGEIGDGGELRHPVVDRLAVLLLDRREVRLRPHHLLGHRPILAPHLQILRCPPSAEPLTPRRSDTPTRVRSTEAGHPRRAIDHAGRTRRRCLGSSPRGASRRAARRGRRTRRPPNA